MSAQNESPRPSILSQIRNSLLQCYFVTPLFRFQPNSRVIIKRISAYLAEFKITLFHIYSSCFHTVVLIVKTTVGLKRVHIHGA